MELQRIGLVTVLALGACTSKNDSSEQNFKAAIDQYLAKKGEVCLDFREWPQEIDTSSKLFGADRPDGITGRMKALESAGLVIATPVVNASPSMGIGGRARTMVRYDLTDAGKGALRKPGTSKSSWSSGEDDLCYGKKSVDKIVKWDAPVSLGEFKATTVSYTYKIDNLAAWASNAQIKASFPELARTVDGISNKPDKHGVELTNLGWEASGLD